MERTEYSTKASEYIAKINDIFDKYKHDNNPDTRANHATRALIRQIWLLVLTRPAPLWGAICGGYSFYASATLATPRTIFLYLLKGWEIMETVGDIFGLFDDDITVWVEDHRGNFVDCSRPNVGFRNENTFDLPLHSIRALGDDIVIQVAI